MIVLLLKLCCFEAIDWVESVLRVEIVFSGDELRQIELELWKTGRNLLRVDLEVEN